MVGELMDWRDRLAKDFKLSKDDFTLKVVEAMPTILNMLDRGGAAKAERYMKKHGVEILTESPIVEVARRSYRLKRW